MMILLAVSPRRNVRTVPLSSVEVGALGSSAACSVGSGSDLEGCPVRGPRSAAAEEAASAVVGPSAAAGTGGTSAARAGVRSEEHTSELQSLMRISYAGFCLQKKKPQTHHNNEY